MNSTVRFTGYYGEGGSGMLQFKVMGPLEVLHDGRDRTPTPPKVRQVLALLLLRANQVVAVDALIEEVWGEDPPLSAVGTMQTYIHQLRKLFERPGTQLMRKPPGLRPDWRMMVKESPILAVRAGDTTAARDSWKKASVPGS